MGCYSGSGSNPNSIYLDQQHSCRPNKAYVNSPDCPLTVPVRPDYQGGRCCCARIHSAAARGWWAYRWGWGRPGAGTRAHPHSTAAAAQASHSGLHIGTQHQDTINQSTFTIKNLNKSKIMIMSYLLPSWGGRDPVRCRHWGQRAAWPGSLQIINNNNIMQCCGFRSARSV